MPRGCAHVQPPSAVSEPPPYFSITGISSETCKAIRRAIIGFGKGETSMNLQVSASDLARNPGAPFIIYGSSSTDSDARFLLLHDHLPSLLFPPVPQDH